MGYFAWDKASVIGSLKWKSAYGDHAATREALYRTLVMDRVAGGRRLQSATPVSCIFPQISMPQSGNLRIRDGPGWLGSRGITFDGKAFGRPMAP